MKTTNITKFCFALIVLAIFSCKKNTDPVPVDNTVKFISTINGASEVPTNASTATGSATASFDKVTKILTLNMTYSGLTATNMHIHKGPVGVSGGVLFGIGAAPFASPITYTSGALTQGQEDSLTNNLYYLNIHSAAFPSGEIRGQILKQ
jgi:CHRD domain